MRRRDFLGAIAGATAASRQARAAQRADPVIGYLYVGSFYGLADSSKKAFWQGVADLGYVRGRNVGFEPRQAGNDLGRVPDLTRDLVRRGVSVIVVSGTTEAVLAARSVTDRIPIVFGNAATDPVGAGIVASLGHPGGNVTGIADFGTALSAKRIELIKLLVPHVSRVGILITPITGTIKAELAWAQEGARALSLETMVVTAGTQRDIDAAFAVFAEKQVDAACVIPNTLLVDLREQVVAMAARHRLPTVYPFAVYPEIGGLMSYASSLTERAYQTGVYTGLVLNGANPADLPVRRLNRFELVLNLGTARTLGLTVPARVLAITDRVIE
jgi:putative ABC transport system substrate-binding protein